MQFRIYYDDTDAGGIVYHANYFKFIERARSELFFAVGQNPMDETGHFVVRRIESDFLASARLGEMLEVKTFLVELKGASCTLHQQIYSETGLLFNAVVQLAHLCGGKVARIPEKRKAVLCRLPEKN
jgi:acyl-CoA thioester hydrolase